MIIAVKDNTTGATYQAEFDQPKGTIQFEGPNRKGSLTIAGAQPNPLPEDPHHAFIEIKLDAITDRQNRTTALSALANAGFEIDQANGFARKEFPNMTVEAGAGDRSQFTPEQRIQLLDEAYTAVAIMRENQVMGPMDSANAGGVLLERMAMHAGNVIAEAGGLEQVASVLPTDSDGIQLTEYGLIPPLATIKDSHSSARDRADGSLIQDDSKHAFVRQGLTAAVLEDRGIQAEVIPEVIPGQSVASIKVSGNARHVVGQLEEVNLFPERQAEAVANLGYDAISAQHAANRAELQNHGRINSDAGGAALSF